MNSECLFFRVRYKRIIFRNQYLNNIIHLFIHMCETYKNMDLEFILIRAEYFILHIL